MKKKKCPFCFFKVFDIIFKFYIKKGKDFEKLK